ncbi:MAG: hypothetical protein AVDCRST_MAG53-2024, partial [uncultured Solirubrobacteraceae bacterium]
AARPARAARRRAADGDAERRGAPGGRDPGRDRGVGCGGGPLRACVLRRRAGPRGPRPARGDRARRGHGRPVGGGAGRRSADARLSRRPPPRADVARVRRGLRCVGAALRAAGARDVGGARRRAARLRRARRAASGRHAAGARAAAPEPRPARAAAARGL